MMSIRPVTWFLLVAAGSFTVSSCKMKGSSPSSQVLSEGDETAEAGEAPATGAEAACSAEGGLSLKDCQYQYSYEFVPRQAGDVLADYSMFVATGLPVEFK